MVNVFSFLVKKNTYRIGCRFKVKTTRRSKNENGPDDMLWFIQKKIYMYKIRGERFTDPYFILSKAKKKYIYLFHRRQSACRTFSSSFYFILFLFFYFRISNGDTLRAVFLPYHIIYSVYQMQNAFLSKKIYVHIITHTTSFFPTINSGFSDILCYRNWL